MYRNETSAASETRLGPCPGVGLLWQRVNSSIVIRLHRFPCLEIGARKELFSIAHTDPSLSASEGSR
jgi:hypothetical protein